MPKNVYEGMPTQGSPLTSQMLIKMSPEMKKSIEANADKFGLSQASLVRCAIWSLCNSSETTRLKKVRGYVKSAGGDP